MLKNQLDAESLQREKGTASRKKSFIVSCDEDLKGMLKYAFVSYGIETYLYQGWKEVLQFSEIDPFDFIIIDCDNVGMDGSKLIMRLREQFSFAIIIGLGKEDKGVAYLRAGANDFLPKPFIPYRLAMMLDGRDIDT
jgi:DNA-binding response OmpR family regulator